MIEEIIDIYNDKNYKLMAEKIDSSDDFFANLSEALASRSTHEHDFNIYTDITCLYWLEKEEQEELRKEKEKEDKLYLLKQSYNWLITDFDIMGIDTKDYDFNNSLDDFLNSEYVGDKY